MSFRDENKKQPGRPAWNRTKYFYDQNGRLLAEVIPATGAGKDYLYLAEDPIARVDWAVTETNLTGNPLRVDKVSPNVHLSWTSFSGGSNVYAVRRKQVVNPNDRTFNGSSVIGGVADPNPATHVFDDPVLTDGNRYDYRVLLTSSSDALFFYHTDHIGTTTAMTDGTGVLVWKAEHRPFGAIHNLTVSTITNNLRFPGQYADGESALYENWHRYYRANTGRYDAPDPASSPGNRGVYVYAEARPTGLVDRSGLWPIFVRPASASAPSPTCNNCSPNEPRIGQAVTKVCSAAGSNPNCRQVLTQLGLLDCFLKRCKTPLPVVCISPEGSCKGCGGPCNNLSDPTKTVFLQAWGFDEGLCGSLSNTVAHEMGHMCGIGADVYHPENQEKADRVGDACGGK